MTCPICSNAEATEKHYLRDLIKIDCRQCGTFTITSEAVLLLENVNSFVSIRWKISAWINEFKPVVVSSTDLETASVYAIPSLEQRATRMLKWITTQYPPGTDFSSSSLMLIRPNPEPTAYGENIVTRSSNLVPVGWNQSFDEMLFMLDEVLFNEMQLLVRTKVQTFQVSAKGLLYLEGRRESVSSIGFCAMWFSEEVQPLWKEVIEPAITAAGYEALRIDSKQHNGKIDDEIMASIRASKFVVSDFTGSRGGVYYEAGFAHGLGLPVIFMCREGDSLHFDIRQYNCIFWTQDKLEEAQVQLKNRILATLGQGPKLVQ
jgi:hypothetical protein